jgi:nucleoside-diphosphate-sugar epimerase
MRPEPPSVLVLGATGFVGAAVMQTLAAAGGCRAVGASRRPGPRGAWRRCDATRVAELEAALQGMECVVNAVRCSGQRMRRVARLLRDAAPRAGIRRIVHVSSAAVYGPCTGLVDETTPLAAPGWGYEGAKIACELLLRFDRHPAPEVVILRPGVIYGPGGRQWTVRICRLLRARRLGDLGAAGDGFCNLIHVQDVAEAVQAALWAPAVPGQAINLATRTPPRWNDVLTSLACAIGAVPVARIGPVRLAVEAALLAPPLGAARRIGGPAALLPEPIPASLLRLLRQEMRLDWRRADALLGFRRTDDRTGLAEAADWFRWAEADARARA